MLVTYNITFYAYVVFPVYEIYKSQKFIIEWNLFII